MGKLANNYVQPLCFLTDVCINPPHPLSPSLSLPCPGTVSLMQAILRRRLKKAPHLSWPLHILISINTLWWEGECCQITITPHLYSEELSVRKRRKKEKYDDECSAIFSSRSLSLFFLTLLLSVFVLFKKKNRSEMKEEVTHWKAVAL